MGCFYQLNRILDDEVDTIVDIERIYQRNIDIVYRICLIQLKNKESAVDASHEVFIKYISNPRRFESLNHERAWFIIVSKNLCRDKFKFWWRKKRDYIPLEKFKEEKNEIGEILGMKESTIQTRLFRGRIELKEKIKGDDNYG